jgi:hypothetical protein
MLPETTLECLCASLLVSVVQEAIVLHLLREAKSNTDRLRFAKRTQILRSLLPAELKLAGHRLVTGFAATTAHKCAAQRCKADSNLPMADDDSTSCPRSCPNTKHNRTSSGRN